MMKPLMSATLIAAAATGLGLAAPARAAAGDVMKACGAKYQAAKAAKTLPAGQSWTQFLAQCRGSATASAAPAQAPRPAARPAGATRPATPASARPLSPAQLAERRNIHICAQQWQGDKAAHRIPAGQTWPKYWSACSKRLKG